MRCAHKPLDLNGKTLSPGDRISFKTRGGTSRGECLFSATFRCACCNLPALAVKTDEGSVYALAGRPRKLVKPGTKLAE